MAYEQLPAAIVTAVEKEMKRTGWPDMVPSYAEFKRPGRSSLFKPHKLLTIADCEQLCEQFTRMARKALDDYERRPNKNAERRAAENIVKANTYRCSYIAKMGTPESEWKPTDVPFPWMDQDEAAEINAKENADDE